MSPQPDIVERLRRQHFVADQYEAADEIERLRTALRSVRASTCPQWQKQIIDEALRENEP